MRAKQATKTSAMRLVEMTFLAPIERLLEEWGAEGLNAPAIQRRLEAHDVVVTTMTVRNWMKALETQNGAEGLDSLRPADSTRAVALGIK